MKINENLLKAYENTALIDVENSDGLPGTTFFDELPNVYRAGVLKSNRYSHGRLVQTYTERENHVGVIAATRLGKTTSYVIPTVISFAMQRIKKNMVITDPKGEIYRYTAAVLRAQGYTVKLLNFRDYKKSECWNPLTPIFRKYRSADAIYDEVGVTDTPEGAKNTFRGKIYDSQEELERDIGAERAMILSEVESEVDNFAQMLITTESSKDPTWEDGARDLWKAFIFAMLQDSDAEENPITEDTFSMSTVFNIMDSFKNTDHGYDDKGYFSKRSHDSKAYALAKNIILDTASGTRSSYVSVFATKLSEYREVTTRVITSCNSFEMAELAENGPVAVFIDFRDELKSQFKTIGLFIQDAYKTLIEAANRRETGRLDVPWYFILDEFGNFAKMRDFDTTISACAGRNIWFILIIQSYAQLNNVYGEAVAAIIRDNLNVHIFFGSNNPDTLEEFSRECGQFTRISPLSAMNGKGAEIETYQIETIPLVTKSRLAHFAEGECVVTEANCGYVMLSRLVRFYECPEFTSMPPSREADYKPAVNPFDERYIYKFTGCDSDDDW